ncbi:lipid scramblase CLPTM1L isoform X2 [Brevipalpus obovatus]
MNNGSMFLHVFITKSKSSEINRDIILSKTTTYGVGSITQYIPKKVRSFKLLDSSEPSREDDSKKAKVGRPITHWKPKMVINIVSNGQNIPVESLTRELAPKIRITKNLEYMPVIYISPHRNRIRDLIPVDRDKTILPLKIDLEPTSIGKLRFFLFIEASFGTMRELGFTEYDTDDVKGILFDTNLFLLMVTVFVSSFHLLFDFLALKNDVQFWRSRSSIEGLSKSTLIWRGVSQIIIALYLHDQQTSLIVVIPADIGALIELWKLKRAFKIQFNGLRISMDSRSKAETVTNEYDDKFMRYLSLFVLYPLVTIGAIYSLLYTEHKSWYSWVIQNAANGVYVFGFLFMLPQLFINYKLKSVAHLPWKVLIYKAFNTFIDDLFAFILTSIPTAHRVAAFRDDIVFIIYLYQRWLYPVDKSRAGEAGEFTEEEKKKDD